MTQIKSRCKRGYPALDSSVQGSDLCFDWQKIVRVERNKHMQHFGDMNPAHILNWRTQTDDLKCKIRHECENFVKTNVTLIHFNHQLDCLSRNLFSYPTNNQL